MKEWTVPQGKHGQKYIIVKAGEVIMGGHWGSGHTDHASTCSREAFLAKQDYSQIISDFGASVLAEILRELGESVPDD